MNRRLVLLLGACLLFGATTAAVVLGGTAAGATDESADSCFENDGYTLGIGDDPGIDVSLHLSILTDPGTPGELGGEFVGRANGVEVVTLATGVSLEEPRRILDNPIAAFELIAYYRLTLPMFEGHVDEPTYEDDTVPVDSAADERECR